VIVYNRPGVGGVSALISLPGRQVASFLQAFGRGIGPAAPDPALIVSGQVEAVEVHHRVPGGHEVLDK